MEKPIEIVLAENIDALFRDRGITSAAHAEEILKIPKSTIDRAWNHRSMTRVDTLSDLAGSMHLKAWQLLVPKLNALSLPQLATDAGQIFKQNRAVSASELIEIIVSLEHASVEDRELVLDLVRTVAARNKVTWRRVGTSNKP